MSRSPFRTTQRAALAQLKSALPETEVALIGAGALSCHLPTTRPTEDIDLVVAIETESFAAMAVNTLRWTQHPKKEHEWTTADGETVDVLPISAEALASRKLMWPSGHVMNVTGLRHALAAPGRLDIDGVTVRLPAVPVIALLKIVAYRDRPPERLKDLQDLAFLLSEYPAVDDDAFFTEEILAEGLVEHEARAWLLGRSLGDLVDDHEAAEVRGFFAAMLAEQVDTGRFIANSPWRHRGHEALERLRRAEAGFRRSAGS